MWYTLAYLVLTAPTDPDIPPYLAAVASFRQAVQSMAVEMEIMDPREVRWMLGRAEDVAEDVYLLRQRYRELADAPPAIDAWRFPERATVNACLTFNRTYRSHLESQWTPGRDYECGEALREVDRLYFVWDCIRDAQGDYYYVTIRRMALKQLREQIGDEAYARGELPCYVPLHRFRTMD
jgi:hypothetical protein